MLLEKALGGLHTDYLPFHRPGSAQEPKERHSNTNLRVQITRYRGITNLQTWNLTGGERCLFLENGTFGRLPMIVGFADMCGQTNGLGKDGRLFGSGQAKSVVMILTRSGCYQSQNLRLLPYGGDFNHDKITRPVRWNAILRQLIEVAAAQPEVTQDGPSKDPWEFVSAIWCVCVSKPG